MVTLKELYTNPETGLGSLNHFIKVATKHGFKRNEAEEFYKKQETAQKFKPEKAKPYFPIIDEAGTYQADLTFFDPYRGNIGVLAIINIRTRLAYAFPIKGKSDAEVLDAFRDFIKLNNKYQIENENVLPCVKLLVDRGKEFDNNLFKEWCERKQITLQFSNVGDKSAQGKVERFNGTLRQLVDKYLDAKDTKDWVDAIPKLVKNYNNRENRSLPNGQTPWETNEADVEGDEEANYRKAERYYKKEIKEGSIVRILKNKNVFSKGRKKWSDEVYVVIDKKPHGHEYEVMDEYGNTSFVKYRYLQVVEDVDRNMSEGNTQGTSQDTSQSTSKVNSEVTQKVKRRRKDAKELRELKEAEGNKPKESKRKVKAKERYDDIDTHEVGWGLGGKKAETKQKERMKH